MTQEFRHSLRHLTKFFLSSLGWYTCPKEMIITRIKFPIISILARATTRVFTTTRNPSEILWSPNLTKMPLYDISSPSGRLLKFLFPTNINLNLLQINKIYLCTMVYNWRYSFSLFITLNLDKVLVLINNTTWNHHKMM